MVDMSPDSILQVEDEQADVELLQVVFKRAGITNPVHVVTDGQMALDYLAGAGRFADRERHPLPCLVLLDLKLPKVDGLDVLEWLRHQPNLKRLVVVVLSSSVQRRDVERAYDLGANSYAQKPPELGRMVEMARSLKSWWLGCNCFAPFEVPPQPAPGGAGKR
jgi:CheY-like chemotaxis protein